MAKKQKSKTSYESRRYGMPFRLKDNVTVLVKKIDPHTTRPMNTKLERILKSYIRIKENLIKNGLDVEQMGEKLNG